MHHNYNFKIIVLKFHINTNQSKGLDDFWDLDIKAWDMLYIKTQDQIKRTRQIWCTMIPVKAQVRENHEITLGIC